MRQYFLTLLISVILIGASHAAEQSDVIQSERLAFRVETLTRGLDRPWGLAFLPDGKMLVTERIGRLRLINQDGSLEPKAIAGVPPVVFEGQGGLLDIALHPRFSSTRWVYLAYAGREGEGVATQVVRAKLIQSDQGYRLENLQQIYRQRPAGKRDVHFGARLVFDHKGNLFITQGERGEQNRAQDLNDLAGKSIHLKDNGAYLPQAPFTQNAAIFSYGHRNMQGAALHPQTGELWATEHGPQGGDELNIVRQGKNYGWPVISYGANYGTGTKIGEGVSKPGMEQPIHQWTPSIAPSGLAFYQGSAFPAWRGNVLVGALKFQMLVRLELKGNQVTHEERLLKNQYGRIRDVRVGLDGLIYLLTDEGLLLRLIPENEVSAELKVSTAQH